MYAGARAPYGVQLQPDKDRDEDKKVMREHTPEVIVVFLWMWERFSFNGARATEERSRSPSWCPPNVTHLVLSALVCAATSPYIDEQVTSVP